MSTPVPGRLGRLHERILTSASNSRSRYTPSFRSVLALGLFDLKVHGRVFPIAELMMNVARDSLRLSRRDRKAIFS
jgi:hypothetical protein